MTMPATGRIATEKQLSFMDALMREREVSERDRRVYGEKRTEITMKQASGIIDWLLKQPKLHVPRETAFGEAISPAEELRRKLWHEFYVAVNEIPTSKYAIPVSELMVEELKEPVHGDLIFLETRKYGGKTYMKRLFGSVGAFTRTTPRVEDALAFLRIIKQDPYKYARTFAEHYKCCGRCGADLTDPRSRELLLGPECRKAFGKK